MKRKLPYWILLIIGLLPFIYVLGVGVYSSFMGYSGLCLFDCELDYGFSAFMDSIIITSYLFWPLYILGVIFLILSFYKLKHDKQADKYKDLL